MTGRTLKGTTRVLTNDAGRWLAHRSRNSTINNRTKEVNLHKSTRSLTPFFVAAHSSRTSLSTLHGVSTVLSAPRVAKTLDTYSIVSRSNLENGRVYFQVGCLIIIKEMVYFYGSTIDIALTSYYVYTYGYMCKYPSIKPAYASQPFR